MNVNNKVWIGTFFVMMVGCSSSPSNGPAPPDGGHRAGNSGAIGRCKYTAQNTPNNVANAYLCIDYTTHWGSDDAQTACSDPGIYTDGSECASSTALMGGCQLTTSDTPQKTFIEWYYSSNRSTPATVDDVKAYCTGKSGSFVDASGNVTPPDTTPDPPVVANQSVRKVGSLTVTVTWTMPSTYDISAVNGSRSDLPANGKISTLAGRTTVQDCPFNIATVPAGGQPATTQIMCGDATVTSFSFYVGP
jgi:hypothetical protein